MAEVSSHGRRGRAASVGTGGRRRLPHRLGHVPHDVDPDPCCLFPARPSPAPPPRPSPLRIENYILSLSRGPRPRGPARRSSFTAIRPIAVQPCLVHRCRTHGAGRAVAPELPVTRFDLSFNGLRGFGFSRIAVNALTARSGARRTRQFSVGSRFTDYAR